MERRTFVKMLPTLPLLTGVAGCSQEGTTQNTTGTGKVGAQQAADVVASQTAYQAELTAAGLGEITTEVAPSSEFFYAEEYHQQYLHKNPAGYCGLGGTGVSCPIF